MPRSMSSLCAACCDWFLSYNSVRIVSMNNPKLGGVNRFIQALVVAYSVFSLLDGRQYMRKETVLGAQDVYGEVEPRNLTAAPVYCNNPEFNYYFNEFWRYDNIACRPMVAQEMLIPGTGEIFVITAVEERNITSSDCTSFKCKTDTQIANYFSVDPEQSVYVTFQHGYQTSWGDSEYNIAAELIDVHGDVVASVKEGEPARFLLAEYLRAAGVSSLNSRATYGGNGSTTVNPRFRLIGINIGVYLEYSNVNGPWLSHDVTLKIKPFNRENGWAQVIRNPQYLEYPSKMLSLTVQGARITYEITGEVGTVDVAAIVNWVVNTIVLMGISRFFADLVAFNFLEESEAYRSRKAESADAFTPLSPVHPGGVGVEMTHPRGATRQRVKHESSDVTVKNPL